LKTMAQLSPIADLLAQATLREVQAELPTFSEERRANAQAVHRDSIMQMEWVLQAVGRQFVTYFPVLAQLTGSAKAALLLGHSIYVSRALLRDSPEREGWFWKTTQEWFVATGLSQKEQVSARELLIERQLLQEARQGMPAKLYFRINLTALAAQLGQLINAAPTVWSWEENAVRRLLGRPLAFYAPMAWLMDSASCGIVLSQWVATYRDALRQPDFKAHRFIYSLSSDHWIGIGISDKTVRRARDLTQALGIAQFERQSAAHGRLMYRVNLTVLADLLTKKVNEIHSLLDSSNQDVKKTAIKISGNQQSRVTKRAKVLLPFSENMISQKGRSTLALSDKQELLKGQEYFRPFSQSRFAEKAEHLIKGFKHTKQQQQKPVNEANNGAIKTSDVVVVLEVGQSKTLEDPLVMPSLLLENEHAIALKLLSGSKQAQTILDEVQGKALAQPGSVRSALALIQSLVRLDAEGRFAPLYAAKVERQRTQKSTASVNQPESPALTPDEKKMAQERLAKLRQGLKSRGGYV
jgi:hypothetical protein